MVTLTGVVSYPIPAYANVPIQPQFYKPSRFVIADVTLGSTTIVETTEIHNYVVGQQVRLLIPPSFGCIQLNTVTGFVLSIPSSVEVELDINSSVGVNSYIASSNTTESAQILAIGDISFGQTNSNGILNMGTFIPGSFQNISPQ